MTSTASANGQIVADAGGFDVLGSYLYTQQLSGATFSVQVTEQDGATTGASQGNFSVGNTVTSTVATSSLALANDASIIIAAGGSLTVTDGATLSSGATVVVEDGGTLVVSALSLGTGTGGVTFDGGTLQASGDLTTAVPITIGAGGATIDTNGFNVTLSGNLSGDSGSGALTETGGGTLTLSGSSTYTGGTVVGSGTLVVSSPIALSSSGQLSVGRSGVVSLLGLLTIPSGGDAAPATTAAATSATTTAATTSAASAATSDTASSGTSAATTPAMSACDNHHDDRPNNRGNDRHDSRCAEGCDQRQRQCRQDSHGEGFDADGREGSDRGSCPAAGFRQRGVCGAAGCSRQRACRRGVRGVNNRRQQDRQQHGERDGRPDQCPQRGVAAQSGRQRRGQGDEPLGSGLFWCHAADGQDDQHGGRADRPGLGGVAGLSGGGPSARPLLRCGGPDCYTLESP